jgi:hypothetical protein
MADSLRSFLNFTVGNCQCFRQAGDQALCSILRRASESDDAVVGMTIVNWWKCFGRGRLPDSLHELERAIEPWTRKIAA